MRASASDHRAAGVSLLAELGWRITPDAPARALLTSALAAARRADAPRGPDLHAYASAMAALAAKEVPSVRPAGSDGKSRVELAESAVAGMVLHERVLVAMRRLAQEDASARFFGDR